jgi:hypothetical protein
MKKNVGKTDMIVRLVLAAILVLLYFVLGNKLLALICVILAIILALTAVTGVCPLYYILRVNTAEKEKKE